MPRLSSALVRQAARRNRYLPSLLRECRDLQSAINELRWLKEHVCQQRGSSQKKKKNKQCAAAGHFAPRSLPHGTTASCDPKSESNPRSIPDFRLSKLVSRRARGEPLQYVLGSQPFGELEIRCRPGVLIPRPETETYTTTVARIVLDLADAGLLPSRRRLKIADLCTGSGCISLLLHSLLRWPGWVPCRTTADARNGSSGGSSSHERMEVCGLPPSQRLLIFGADVSPFALNLAADNIKHNLTHLTPRLDQSVEAEVKFDNLDVLALGSAAATSLAMAAVGVAEGAATAGTLNEDGMKTLPSGTALQQSQPQTPFHISTFLSQTWDILISNPPYLSPAQLRPGTQSTTSRSVRDHEPIMALVPPPLPPPAAGAGVPSVPLFSLHSTSSYAREDEKVAIQEHDGADGLEVRREDTFYAALIHIAKRTESKLIVLEVGDGAQAARVREMARSILSPGGAGDLRLDGTAVQRDLRIETWRDDGSVDVYAGGETDTDIDGDTIDHAASVDGSRRGKGTADPSVASVAAAKANERTVVIWRGDWMQWRRKR